MCHNVGSEKFMCSERFTGSGCAKIVQKNNRIKWYLICPEPKVFHRLQYHGVRVGDRYALLPQNTAK
jgi:hypothetical protein